MMKITCPNCSTAIRSENMNINNFMAKCHNCHEVFNFGTQAGVKARPAGSIVEKTSDIIKDNPRPEIAKPQSVSLVREGGALILKQRWFSFQIIFLVFFCVAWDGFLVFWYSMALVGEAPWIFLVFPVIHVAVGVGLTYTALAGLLNSSIVSVNPQKLSITHGPLPWKGNMTLSIWDLTQIFCQEEMNHRKNGTYYTYQLSALMKDGRKIKLLSRLESADIAIYMEQQIESWLKIQDRPVHGEIPREV
jgi:predicted Zn finger-like uncharacterized protein